MYLLACALGNGTFIVKLLTLGTGPAALASFSSGCDASTGFFSFLYFLREKRLIYKIK